MEEEGKMITIYEPRGRAREYSPLALNIYNKCDHNCRYCYVPLIRKKWGNAPVNIEPFPRRHLLTNLVIDAERYSFGAQVLLCFSGDPYCRADVNYKTTRNVLTTLLENNVTVAILTKGGKRCLRDLDLFKEFKAIKVGATLTFIEEKDSRHWEKNASLPEDRFKTLEKLKEMGIMTWVSLEPVIDPEQTLKIIDRTHNFIDQYKVGKLNHFNNKTDWKDFGIRAIEKLNKYGKKFYVKNDLARFIPVNKMTKEQRNADYLAIEGR